MGKNQHAHMGKAKNLTSQILNPRDGIRKFEIFSNIAFVDPTKAKSPNPTD